MKTYLNKKSFYAINENKLVYKVSEFETYDGYNSIHYNLELVSGWDYINPDYTDKEGWVSANNFIEDIQSETVVQYFMEESTQEAFETNCYNIIDFDETKIHVKNNSNMNCDTYGVCSGTSCPYYFSVCNK